jgi:hypothetical protein
MPRLSGPAPRPPAGLGACADSGRRARALAARPTRRLRGRRAPSGGGARAGVADGVGSWADYPIPVDAGIYARLLMANAKAAAAGLAPSALAPLAVMRAAHSQTLVQVRECMQWDLRISVS